MTLRHRLLLVYLIVVLLSAATVGVAVFELRHARQIIQQIQDWNGIVLRVEKLKSGWPPESMDAPPPESGLKASLAEQFLYLASNPKYLDVESVRRALRPVYTQYEAWLNLPADQRGSQTDMVRQPLESLTLVLESELAKLNKEASRQDFRTQVLLVVVLVLTVLHVAVIGSLLRRWLLDPMARLGRQVAALGRDEPPPEPLLTAPRELADLASALDGARRSLGTLRQQLLEGERLTTIGQFAAQLAHNLRNPLASIRAAAQMTARQRALDPASAQRMEEIVASVDRLSQWVVGLTEVARREPTATGSADVVATLERVRQALKPELAAKELTLTMAAPPEGLWCRHDPATLEQALVAMVVNAIEASPLGETITLRAERIERDPQPGADRPAGPACEPGLGQGGEASRRWCRISVCDNGPGLPADDPERIFESSYSTKQRGLGLGLALARQVLQRQGGAAHACNGPQGGAVVYVELPLAE